MATGGNVSTEQVGRNVRGLLELLDGQGTPGPSELRTPWPNHSPPPKKPPDPWAQATGRCPGRAGPPRHPARRRPTRRLRGETPPGPAPHRTTPACPSRSTRHRGLLHTPRRTHRKTRHPRPRTSRSTHHRPPHRRRQHHHRHPQHTTHPSPHTPPSPTPLPARHFPITCTRPQYQVHLKSLASLAQLARAPVL